MRAVSEAAAVHNWLNHFKVFHVVLINKISFDENFSIKVRFADFAVKACIQILSGLNPLPAVTGQHLRATVTLVKHREIIGTYNNSAISVRCRCFRRRLRDTQIVRSTNAGSIFLSRNHSIEITINSRIIFDIYKIDGSERSLNAENRAAFSNFLPSLIFD